MPSHLSARKRTSFGASVRSKTAIALAFLGALGFSREAARSADRSASLPRSAPEAQGISSAALLALVEEAEREIDALHSIMIVRHGRVVLEGWWAPYAAREPHQLYSLSKSFTSTAIGIAAAEGRLAIDDRVLDFFPDAAPAEPSNHLKAMRVRDLLAMSTGHHAEDIADFPYFAEEDLVRKFLSLPVAHRPGTHFVYNTPASFLLSAIVQKATGQTTLEYLRPRLFEPLGIEDPTWEATAGGISLGGFGLNLRTEDIARFGQLYLQRGEWGGRRILPAEWVDLATSRQTSNGSDPSSDWEQGYGFQFWRCRHGAYRGDGAFGQFCVVLPDEDAVVAATGGMKDMGAFLRLLWRRLLPELRPAPLPADEAAAAALRERLSRLELRPQAGEARSGAAARVSGKTFRLDANDRGFESLTARFEPSGASLLFRVRGEEARIECGYGEWRKGGSFPTPRGLAPPGETPVAGSGAWIAEDAFAARVVLYRTPYVVTFTLRFAGEELLLDQEMNVAFGPTTAPRLTGR